MRRLLREQDQVGAAPIAMTILSDANTGAGQDPHRPGCGGSTPPSCRDRVASIAAMQRSLKPQSTGQHRGDPPFRAGVAQQRQQQFRKLPGNSPHGSASLPVGPKFKCRVQSEECRMAGNAAAHILHSAFIILPSTERAASNRQVAGEIPAGSAILPR